MPHAPFVHLRAHSAYSLSEGAIKVQDLVKLATKHQLPALAIADTGNLFCSLEFSKACADQGVQPVIGCVISIDASLKTAPTGHTAILDKLVLFAKDAEGYQHLLHLVSKSYMDTPEGMEPHITLADFENDKYAKGLIALTAGTAGSVGRLLFEERYSEAEEMLLTLHTLFPDALYVEITRHGEEKEEAIEHHLIELAYKHNLPLVATNEIFFASRDMYEAHDALLCIAEGRYVSEEDRKRLTQEHYFKSAEEMQTLFADLPEAIANTLVIAKRCAVKSEEHPPILPMFNDGKGNSEAESLRVEAHEGLATRLEHYVFTPSMNEEARARLREIYTKRLDFELDVIISMKFPGYFLIVSDFIKWSKRHHIPVGPGRGSGAGSVVAWCLEITDLDPIRFGLLFERFLNPERVSMPDFDIDFCQDRRDEVINYVQERYGYDRVAQIITFGKLQARAVVRDVGRVLQMSYGHVDKISKLIPNNPANPVTLAQAIELEPLLRKAQEEEEQVAKLLSIALQLEGLNRHVSTHAAGVVIADRALETLVPLYRDPRSTMPVVQYSMKYAEAAGLVKFDFLGLKTLTVIANTCKLIEQTTGEHIDINHIPLNDPTTFQLLSRGEAVGVFQFESAGMRDALRKMKPDTIEDLIALGALYRPGPMDNIPTYIACKHGLEKPDYLHPSLEGVLKETFGVIIYQEQVMQIAQILAGYTLGAADLLRRAMGKKIKAEMDAQREIFVTGAVKNNVNKDQASSIFDLVAKFAGYGFNKSHAAAYALISYQTAYLKANFPVEFLVASMNLDMHDTDKMSVFHQEARAMQIPLLLPDINHSEALFSVEICEKDGKKVKAIRYALGAIKNVGVPMVASLTEARKNKGAFKSVEDLGARCDSKQINKRLMEGLIKAGAFDSLNPNRRQLIESVDMLVRYSHECIEARNSTQISLFGEHSAVQQAALKLQDVPDWPLAERLHNEREAIGFYLSGHPLDAYKFFLEQAGVMPSALLATKAIDGHSRVKLAGVVSDMKIKVSTRGRFAYVQLSDNSGIFEVAVFDEALLDTCRELLESTTPIYINTDARKDEGGIRLIAESIMPLDQFLQQQRAECTIWLHSPQAVAQILTLCKTSTLPGNAYVRLFVPVTDTETAEIRLPGCYPLSPATLAGLEGTGGIGTVHFQAAHSNF